MEIATHCEHSWEFQFFLEMKMEMEIDMHCVRAINLPNVYPDILINFVKCTTFFWHRIKNCVIRFDTEFFNDPNPLMLVTVGRFEWK